MLELFRILYEEDREFIEETEQKIKNENHEIANSLVERLNQSVFKEQGSKGIIIYSVKTTTKGNSEDLTVKNRYIIAVKYNASMRQIGDIHITERIQGIESRKKVNLTTNKNIMLRTSTNIKPFNIEFLIKKIVSYNHCFGTINSSYRYHHTKEKPTLKEIFPRNLFLSKKISPYISNSA